MSAARIPPTIAEILSARSGNVNGSWKRATLEAWGVPWPPKKGWRKRLEAESRAYHKDQPEVTKRGRTKPGKDHSKDHGPPQDAADIIQLGANVIAYFLARELMRDGRQTDRTRAMVGDFDGLSADEQIALHYLKQHGGQPAAEYATPQTGMISTLISMWPKDA